MNSPLRTLGLGLGLGGIALLSACVSIGVNSEPPTQLLTLTAMAKAPSGTEVIGTSDTAIYIETPQSPQKLNVTRIPVQVDDSSIAYLKDGVWVEKPTRLFQSLLAETLRSRSGRIVVDRPDQIGTAATHLRGTLRNFGYDARSSSAVVTYDAIRDLGDGVIETRRFERQVGNIPANYVEVSNALNIAANEVAIEVADWVAGSR